MARKLRPTAATRLPSPVTKALSVLLIDDNPARAEIVESGLRDAGYVLLERLGGTYDLPARVAALKPDVIVVSIDSPSRDAIEDLRRTTEQQPRPIALFADRSDPATIAAAMEAGVCAYVVKGLAQDRVQSVVDVAVAHFNRYHVMREELDRARQAVLGQQVLGMESTSARMRRLGRSEVTGSEILSTDEVIDRFNEVTLDKVGEVAATVLSAEKVLSVVSPLPESEFAKYV